MLHNLLLSQLIRAYPLRFPFSHATLPLISCDFADEAVSRHVVFLSGGCNINQPVDEYSAEAQARQQNVCSLACCVINYSQSTNNITWRMEVGDVPGQRLLESCRSSSRVDMPRGCLATAQVSKPCSRGVSADSGPWIRSSRRLRSRTCSRLTGSAGFARSLPNQLIACHDLSMRIEPGSSSSSGGAARGQGGSPLVEGSSSAWAMQWGPIHQQLQPPPLTIHLQKEQLHCQQHFLRLQHQR